jgi:hypothetical protein
MEIVTTDFREFLFTTTLVNKGKRRETGGAPEDPPLSHSLVPFGLGGVAAR